MNIKNSVYCIVPNWNGKDLIGPCLDSLLSQTEEAEIIVVDNGSTDGSQAFIEKTYPGVLLVRLDENYGFAGGVNAGIKTAMENGAEFVALLNNDAVASNTWVENLAKTARSSSDTGILASKIIRMDRKHLDSTGEFYSTWGLPFPRGRNEIDSAQYDKQTEILAASGGASLYRATMLDQVGLFDEDFFAYFEDVDISLRAQLAGWKVRYEPAAVAYHHINATTSKHGDLSLYHSSKNFLMLYAKNMPRRLYLKYLPLFILQYLRWLITSTLRGKLLTYLKGTFAAIRLYPDTVYKRRVIQKSRKVPVSYIDAMLYHGRPPKPPKLKAQL